MSQVHNLFKTSRPTDKPSLAPQPHALEAQAPYETGTSAIASVTARIPPKHRLVVHTEPSGLAADRFRFLRLRLRQIWPASKPKSVLITSPLPHDGKSTVALNLASALSEQGKFKVLVIEADLHHNCLTRMLGLHPWPGLAECLAGKINAMEAVRRVDPLGWYLLPAGNPPENPSDLLHTAGMAGIMHGIVPEFDWVVIDSPPVLPVTDAFSLCQLAGGTLLVVRAGATPDEAVEQSVETLGRQNLVGMVLNGADAVDRLYSTYSSYRTQGKPSVE